MQFAVNQVLLRNQDYFAQGRWLIVNPPEADIFQSLGNGEYFGFHQYYTVFEQCRTSAPDFHTFAPSYVPSYDSSSAQQNEFDGAIIYMPKAKEQAKMLINNMADCVKHNGQIFLVGENKSGIKSANKLFEDVSQQVNKIDSARHCALYCATISKEHDKTCNFDLNDWLKWYQFEHEGESITVASLPGVFSANELDAGTKLLLDNLPKTLSGDVLDFACGAGVIGCAVAKRYPKVRLTLVDVSALALHCATLTLERNSIEAKIVASDGLSNVNGRFDFVLTNPPFHTGIQTDYSVTERFIMELKTRLNKNAKLVLVANRFLPYPELINKSLGKVTTTAQTSKFNLYQN